MVRDACMCPWSQAYSSAIAGSMLDWEWLRCINWLCRARHAARCHRSAAERHGSPAAPTAWDSRCNAAEHSRAGSGRPAAAASLWRHAATAASAAGLASTAANGRPCWIARQPCPAAGTGRPGRPCCTAGSVDLSPIHWAQAACGLLSTTPWMIWCLRMAIPSSGNLAKQPELHGWLVSSIP